jgi:hypothetical protein
MRPELPEETWQDIEEFFRQTPEASEKLPSFQKMMDAGEQRGRQKTLIRLLRRKFPEVPDTVVQQVEATEDIEQLDRWLDGMLDVETLDELGLTV